MAMTKKKSGGCAGRGMDVMKLKTAGSTTKKKPSTYMAGGMAKKKPAANQKGLKKLPKAVRNKMGFMNKGGMAKKKVK